MPIKLPAKTEWERRINTVMQTCFFAISEILEREEAILLIKDAIKKAYGSKGEKILQSNYKAVDNSVENLFEVEVPDTATVQTGKCGRRYQGKHRNLCRM
jgi:pyruvate-ferredoxin/flavodoxin oxidoreductase